MTRPVDRYTNSLRNARRATTCRGFAMHRDGDHELEPLLRRMHTFGVHVDAGAVDVGDGVAAGRSELRFTGGQWPLAFHRASLPTTSLAILHRCADPGHGLIVHGSRS